ncbi:TlpA disulfide reductase family protein [Sphingobacterium paucimobilis]|uniref:Thioredoxin domain-containing protein n=1 Tax=Sphingobacterium paucimobilis HER1398 TaxID=1346330 RepID=U2J5K7_9SPHI|nr:TlpA disulfide reductase family protein [Sphingobacterium paucimobilis]ERJ57948.1 hypothetical protein M472_04130 [Sphingobacterium paucimobilis HER1398]
MNNTLKYITLCFGLISAAQAQQFKIQGKLSPATDQKIILLSYTQDGQDILDSAVVKKGLFSLQGTVTQPVKAGLRLKEVGEKIQPSTMDEMAAIDNQEFYLEGGKVSVKGVDKMKTAQITGGATQSDYLALQQQLKPFQEQMAPLSAKMRELFETNDEKGQNELFPQLRAIRVEMNKVDDKFIKSHPDSYVSFDMVMSHLGMINPKTFEPLFNGLSERLRNTDQAKVAAEQLKLAKLLDIGQPAIDFSQETADGHKITLSSLKGKYVLVDFWASWCGPCRGENPHLVKAYDEFKNKNFEILGVSLDSKKDAWLKAIHDDGLPWLHVSDLKGWKNEVATTYGVHAVPQNYLLDANGIIIAKNLRGEELIERLSELLNK